MYEDLINKLRELPHLLFVQLGEHEDVVYQAADAIEELDKKSPKLDRGFGEWQADYDGYSDGEPVCDMWWCSECGTYFDEWDDKPTWNFCPFCGAEMRPRPKEET